MIGGVCMVGLSDLFWILNKASQIDLYEKSKQFVSLFQEMKKNSGQLSKISIRKLNFQGKIIGLKEYTLNLLVDVLNGKN